MTKLWNKNYVQLLLLEVCLQLGLYIIRPVVSSYAVVLGATLTAAGFAAGASSGASLVARPFCGKISDRLNKKKLLVASACVFLLSSVACSLTTSLIVVNLLLIVQGVAFTFKSTLVISLTRILVPRNKVGSAVGWLSIAFTIASALGPALGLFLGEKYGFEVSFFAASVVFLVGFALSMNIHVPAASFDACMQSEITTKAQTLLHATKKSESLSRRNSLSGYFYLPALPCSLVDCMAATAQGTTVALIFLIASAENIEGVALYFVAYSVVTAISRPLFGMLNDKYGACIVIPLFIIAAGGMFVLYCSHSTVGVVCSAVLMALGQAPIHSVMQAESIRQADEATLARAANTSYLFPDIGMFLGPLLGGVIMGAYGGRAVLLVNFFYLVCGFVIACVWCCKRKTKLKNIVA